MPSPFPGMDPYLEDPTRWSGVHARLLTLIADTLGDVLAPSFIVAVEERVYVASPDDLVRMPWMQPDVFLVESSVQSPAPARGLPINPALVIEAFEEWEMRERYLQILDVETRNVVTTIEVVPPTNKTAETTGRDKFLDKRRKVFASHTHWIEIDLLRAGERPPEVQGRGDYYVLLHRSDQGTSYKVWPVALRGRLPVIAVPTLAPFPDTPLDLQAVVDTVYQRGHYDLAIRYDRPVPAPQLQLEDAAWARERVEQWRRPT